MKPAAFPTLNRNHVARDGNRRRSRSFPHLRACAVLGLWAIYAGCGSPQWPGGISAILAWSPRGVRVVEVPEGGPAHAAGLQIDDRLVAIDGEPVADQPMEAVRQQLSGEVGSYVELVVLRDEKPLELRIERVPYTSRKHGVFR